MTIATEPKYFRSGRSTGGENIIDRKGGMFGAGIIRNVAVISRGEALGHDLWIDEQFVGDTVEHINRPNKGVKARFTHPSLSGDGMGKYLGRIRDASKAGDKAFADFHFSEAAHKTPDGDLATYVMDLADEDPEAFGLSISFEVDRDAMEEFDGPVDERNTQLLEHARISKLFAADVVDDPAANPDGLFHRSNPNHAMAEDTAEYLLGLSDKLPAECFGIDANRARSFVARFLDSRHLKIGAITMADETTTTPEPEVEKVEEVTAEVVETKESEVVEAPASEAAAPAAELAADRQDAARFLAAFGPQGAVWFAEGKTFEEADNIDRSNLRAELEELRKLKGVPNADGEQQPIDFADGDTQTKKRKGFANKLKFSDSK